jgi:hypothetical protein
MFYLPDQADGEATPVKLGLIAVGIYLFAMAYSWVDTHGLGPGLAADGLLAHFLVTNLL